MLTLVGVASFSSSVTVDLGRVVPLRPQIEVVLVLLARSAFTCSFDDFALFVNAISLLIDTLLVG